LSEPSPAPHPGLTDLAREMLPELMRRHGIETAREPDGRVRVAAEGLRVECAAFPERSYGERAHVRLNVRLGIDRYPELPIAAPLSGYGETPVHAVGDALMDWLHRVLEPTRAALGHVQRKPDGTMNSRSERGADVSEIAWDVYAGEPVLVHSGQEPRPTIEEVIGDQLLLGLIVDPITDAINSFPERRLHWAKVFVARVANDRRTTECLIDNLPHPHPAKLEAFRFPRYDGVLGLRYFAVFVERSRRTA